MNYLKDIVDVDITIENPVASTEAYSNILIVAPAGTGTSDETMPDALRVTSLDDLTYHGYTANDPAYEAVGVAFAQTPEPNIIYLTAIGEDEEVADALSRAQAAGEWYGFTLAGIDEDKYTKAADWAEANHKLFGFNFSGDEIPVDITGRDYTWAIYSGSTGEKTESNANKYLALGLMSKCFGNMPGSQTWNFKTISGAAPSNLNASQIRKFNDGNILFYIRVSGRNITQDSKVGSGEWIDVIRTKDYLISEIQTNVFSLLARNPKVPFNDAGIGAIKGAVTSVLMAAQRNGAIDADAADEDGNLEPGYTVSVPAAINIPKTDKKARQLRGVTFTARLAGAIHFVRIRGTLVYGGAE